MKKVNGSLIKVTDSDIGFLKSNPKEFWKSIVTIRYRAFSDCHELKEIIIPGSITNIENYAFYACASLQKMTILKGVTTLGDHSCFYCGSLKKITIPKSITSIGNSAFSNCKSLKKITIPIYIDKINDETFRLCKSLKAIMLPKKIKSIGNYAFYNCSSLKKIKLPEKITNISQGTFYNCTSLQEIIIPQNVTNIEQNAFFNCSSLKKIIIPKNLTNIGNNAFSKCSSLKKITIPTDVTSIGDEAFSDCTSLQEIIIPDSVTNIGKSAFFTCSSARKIVLSKKITNISAFSFFDCTSLKEIAIPNNVTSIEQDAFYGCNSLKEMTLSKNITNIGEHAIPFENFQYIIKNENYFHLTNNPNITGEKIEISDNEILNRLIIIHWKEKNIFLEEYNNASNKETLFKVYNYLCTQLNKENFLNFVKNKNMKFFNKIHINDKLKEKSFNDFIKFYYNLGGFLQPITKKRKTKSGNEIEITIDYAQKIEEFITNALTQIKLSFDKIHTMFDSMEFNEFNPNFTKFFLDKNNFEKLLEEERKQSGFIARCYNEFKKIEKAHTSNKGNQRQLLVTVEKCKDYFIKNKFAGINEETRPIAETIAPYFSRQASFNNAIKINQERMENNTPNHILNNHLKETDLFKTIEDYKKEINDINKDTLSTITELANKKFTFELLSKDSPINFILGKLCSCCAHLEGTGYGIMRASIVHPDVQNIVIKNNKGEIIAKSTLYINRNERYGVCNNVEVNINVSEEDKELIYKKYELAVKSFAEKYNEENKDKPLKTITVGMHLNDLNKQIKKHKNKSLELYQAINYGTDEHTYLGDSSNEQYIIWKNQNIKKNQ